MFAFAIHLYQLDDVIIRKNCELLVSQKLNKSKIYGKNHYHVRCIKCGEIFDVDMDQIPDLLERIHNTHGIEFVDYDISFKGICPKCREKVKDEQHG